MVIKWVFGAEEGYASFSELRFRCAYDCDLRMGKNPKQKRAVVDLLVHRFTPHPAVRIPSRDLALLDGDVHDVKWAAHIASGKDV